MLGYPGLLGKMGDFVGYRRDIELKKSSTVCSPAGFGNGLSLNASGFQQQL